MMGCCLTEGGTNTQLPTTLLIENSACTPALEVKGKLNSKGCGPPIPGGEAWKLPGHTLVLILTLDCGARRSCRRGRCGAAVPHACEQSGGREQQAGGWPTVGPALSPRGLGEPAMLGPLPRTPATSPSTLVTETVCIARGLLQYASLLEQAPEKAPRGPRLCRGVETGAPAQMRLRDHTGRSPRLPSGDSFTASCSLCAQVPSSAARARGPAWHRRRHYRAQRPPHHTSARL